ncbi:protein of unknown function [Xenorhabdus bovienii]|uniref:Uncharacterized protein n=1 Tax=Xenorhabdus bovienii TaxID=40576 RepID=A0A0B6X8R6_XENBV|nr:protein of unknown function [Xenorhabdus bovienii]
MLLDKSELVVPNKTRYDTIDDLSAT